MTRKNGKEAQAQTEVVETPVETVEVSEETEVSDTDQAAEQQAEQELIPDQLTGVEIICSDCDDLDIDELKQVIDYCSNRIDELQRSEVEALEEQMRAIQDKLLAMKGFRGKAVSEKTRGAEQEAKRSRTEKVVINPENPSQIYRFGKVPSWLTALCEKTGKQVWELRE